MQTRQVTIERVNKLLDSRAREFLEAMIDGLWQKMEPVIDGPCEPFNDADKRRPAEVAASR